ncbi:MAG: response regulator transcription factor [Sphingobacteriales bacterium]|nr:response regulator transcription factor [Sphingobacteriales bacterium]
MLQYNCIIIEDEPLAAEILTDYVKQVPFLNLKSVCGDALFAMDQLQREKIDLMFLDIHLPKLKGLDFLESLTNPPFVIVTTAYNEYAIQGFELNVVDYLLKPIRFNRFLKAVNKLRQLAESGQAPVYVQSAQAGRAHTFFNVGKKKVKIYFDDILYIESIREYIKITTKEKNILTKYQLTEIETVLKNSNFLRIHRSFIVAKDKITAFTATDVEINNRQIPIGRSYKELVMGLLEKGE